MLHTIVFLSGAVLMSLEMLGSRLLAPTFGSSIYVWGALITTVMAALTLGYYLGGRAADRRPSMAVMGCVLGAAGLYVSFLPYWTAPASWVLSGFGPRTGALLASLAFFFPPSILMAMISPYGVRLAGRSLTTLGRTAGRLSSVSSAGSIVGTLVTSFSLIPAIGVRNIVHGLGVLLLLMAAAAFYEERRLERPKVVGGKSKKSPPKLFPVFLVACLVAAAASGAAWYASASRATWQEPGGTQILYEGDSLYHHITVDQSMDRRELHFNNSLQSAMYVNDPLRMVFAYTSYLHLSVVARPEPERALFIGLGGGSAPAKFLHDYPSLRAVDVVEIDPKVVAVAKQYFALPRDARLRLVVQDGRLFVEQVARNVATGQARPYDIIVIDAYNSDATPYHLTTREFLTKVRAILSPDGAVAANVIGCLDGPKSLLLRSMLRTYAAVFPQIYLFPIGGVDGGEDLAQRNNILLATNDPARRSSEQWLAQAASLAKQGAVSEAVTSYAECLVDEARIQRAVSASGSILLTDDYAPVDILQCLL
ncbi:MAG: spermidine synthase [Betaproteobacteria bacterium]